MLQLHKQFLLICRHSISAQLRPSVIHSRNWSRRYRSYHVAVIYTPYHLVSGSAPSASLLAIVCDLVSSHMPIV